METKANTTAKALQTGNADATLIDEFCGQQALQGHDVARPRPHSSEIDTRAGNLPATVEISGSRTESCGSLRPSGSRASWTNRLAQMAVGCGKELSPMPKVTGSSATFRLALDD
jgi:hypothetical protein